MREDLKEGEVYFDSLFQRCPPMVGWPSCWAYSEIEYQGGEHVAGYTGRLMTAGKKGEREGTEVPVYLSGLCL